MLGAIIGDVVGSVHEFEPKKDYDFYLYNPAGRFTDDTVCTIAIADALLSHFPSFVAPGSVPAIQHGHYQLHLRYWCRRYPNVGYGASFKAWLSQSDPMPMESYGNGAAMRVSPIGYVPLKLDDAFIQAKLSAQRTHNHPEAEQSVIAVVSAIRAARVYGPTENSMQFIKERIEKDSGYDLSASYQQTQEKQTRTARAKDTVPQAIIAFLASTSFEDCIRKAVALGGDTDTQAAIAGAIAEAYYRKLPERLVQYALDTLPPEMTKIIFDFYQKFDMRLVFE